MPASAAQHAPVLTVCPVAFSFSFSIPLLLLLYVGVVCCTRNQTTTFDRRFFFLVSIPNFTWAAAAAQAYVSKSSRALTSHGKWRNTWRGLVAEKKGPRVGSRHLFGLPCVCVSPSLSLSGGVLLLLPFLFQKVPILLRCNREKGPPRWITLRVRVAVRRWEVVGDTAAVCVASGRGARAGSNSFGCQSESNFAAD